MPPRKTKRADGRYTATLRYADPASGERKRAYFYGRTQAEVTGKLRAARERLQAGSALRDASRTLSDWLAEWRATMLSASNCAPSTKALYRSLTRLYVEPVIGSVRLDRLQPSDVARLLLALEAGGKSASTRRNTYAALRGALDDAVSNGLLASNPAAKVSRPRSDSQEARSLDVTEVAALLRGAAAYRYGGVLKVILATGLRRGEVLALRWSDIDLERAEAHIRGSLGRRNGTLSLSATKTARGRRIISLSPAVLVVLRAQRRRQATERLAAGNLWSETDFVFTTELGSPVDPRNLLRTVSTAKAASGLTGAIGVHTLRHTYATTALLNNVHLHVVSRNLGHSSIAITADIYGHLTDVAARAAASAVSDALGL